MTGVTQEIADKREARDAMNTQNHYARFKIEPMDFIVANKLGFREGNIIKYVCRYPFKGTPREDLYKALDYLQRIIEEVEKEN